MSHRNVEIKARCGDPSSVESALREAGADHHGRDHQIDTYFCCDVGRLKLRQGQLETALIHYDRSDEPSARLSAVSLYHPVGPEQAGLLREVLSAGLAVRVVVDKRREIYYAGNVKFHVDDVTGLGRFVEIEAVDADGTVPEETLREQVAHWMEKLGIPETDLVAESYSDLLLA